MPGADHSQQDRWLALEKYSRKASFWVNAIRGRPSEGEFEIGRFRADIGALFIIKFKAVVVPDGAVNPSLIYIEM